MQKCFPLYVHSCCAVLHTGLYSMWGQCAAVYDLLSFLQFAHIFILSSISSTWSHLLRHIWCCIQNHKASSVSTITKVPCSIHKHRYINREKDAYIASTVHTVLPVNQFISISRFYPAPIIIHVRLHQTCNHSFTFRVFLPNCNLLEKLFILTKQNKATTKPSLYPFW